MWPPVQNVPHPVPLGPHPPPYQPEEAAVSAEESSDDEEVEIVGFGKVNGPPAVQVRKFYSISFYKAEPLSRRLVPSLSGCPPGPLEAEWSSTTYRSALKRPPTLRAIDPACSGPSSACSTYSGSPLSGSIHPGPSDSHSASFKSIHSSTGFIPSVSSSINFDSSVSYLVDSSFGSHPTPS